MAEEVLENKVEQKESIFNQKEKIEKKNDYHLY